MPLSLTVVVVITITALCFDFTNGFHDAANAIATSVSTRALAPRTALALAAVMNVAGASLGTGVASTIGDGIIEPGAGPGGLAVILAGVLAAIAWNLLTWRLGLPTSSSHALIGGLVGAALVSVTAVHWGGILTLVVLPMVLSPVVGIVLGYLAHTLILWLFRRARPRRVTRGFHIAQTMSAAAMGLGHGLQDGQKSMGVIVLALVTAGYQERFHVPEWVVLMVALVIASGTYVGGRRIIRTLGHRIVHLDPPRGFAAEAGAAAVLYVTAFAWHSPISTTHTITSSILGAGATRGLSAVHWNTATSIVGAWFLTLPGAATAGAAAYLALRAAAALL